MATPLWFDKFSILYEKKYLFEIIPSRHFDFNRKLNSLLRLSIYYSIITYLVNKKKTNMFYIPFIVALSSYVLSKRYKETFQMRNLTESMNNNSSEDVIQGLEGECKTPTKDNPFMNPEIYDYNTKNVQKSSCNSYNNKGVQSYSDKLFSSSLIRDVNDLFGKNNSQRQFILCLEIPYRMTKIHLQNGCMQHLKHVKKVMDYNVLQICMVLVKGL